VNPEGPPLIRLYLDEDVHKRVAAALRLRGFDVVSAHEVGSWGLTDEEQLTHAAAEGRTLFTFNTADYIQLHVDWLQRGKEHHGIIVSDQLPISETAHRLLDLLNKVHADEMRNQIRWLHALR